MRLTALVVLLVLGMGMTAQKQKDLHNTFLRVYDHNGKKIAKGKLTNITHNTLHLKRGNKGMGVNYKDIGTIKTKKSRGHEVLVGTGIGAATSAIISAIATEPDAWFSPTTKGQGALYGGIFGAFSGATIGSVVGLAKREETIFIKGDPEAWKRFLTRFPGTNPNGLLTFIDEGG